MQPPTPRHEFAYGFKDSRSTRLILLTLGGVVGVPAAGCLAGILGVAIASLAETRGSGAGGELLAVPVILVCLLAGGTAAWIVFNILAVARMGARLEGSRLTVRQHRSRTVDLARARSVSLRPTRARWKAVPAGVVTATGEHIPEVVVVADAGPVRMRLSDGERVPLPPQDLLVLANALAAVPAAGAGEVARHLHAMADR